jgi:hypothetical protein
MTTSSVGNTYLDRDLLARHGFLHFAVHERVVDTEPTEYAESLQMSDTSIRIGFLGYFLLAII